MKTNSGNDIQAKQMGSAVAVTGSATSPTSTGFTTTGLTSGAYVGQLVQLGATFGVITANTATSVTVDRWYNPASLGGAAASTPSAGTFVILPGGAPALFMGLGDTNTSPSATDTAMSGEITTAGGGLIRQLAAVTHTAGAASYTLTGTFTANGTDSLPVPAYRIGVFQSLTADLLLFETLLNVSAVFGASGDALVVTEAVSL